jgi:hypothetical protein
MTRLTGLAVIGLTGLLQSSLAFGQEGMGMGMGMGMGDEPDGLEPTYANVAYGSHELNVLDFWQATASSPTPLVVFFHGGAFRAGSKDSLATGSAEALQALLDAGISVASADYRLTDDAPLPASFTDSMRALQFLRSNSEEWNLDKSRVGAFGNSAGAAISMWLAFHDEMGTPDASDSIAHESTRLTAIASESGQTMIDPEFWAEWIPGMDDPTSVLNILRFSSDDPVAINRVTQEISALPHLSADDPPIYMSYRMAPDDPIPTEGAAGWQIHHVIFGIKLKEKADDIGLESHLSYPGVQSSYSSVAEFFRDKLQSN